MRRILIVITATALALSGLATNPTNAVMPTQVMAGSSTAHFETAVPATFGAGVQNVTPHGDLHSVSCSSAGNCVAVGSFLNTAGGTDAYTQSQTGGTWANATPATFGSGIQPTTPDAHAEFFSVSCPLAGNCVAAGGFTNVDGGYEAFTQTQSGGNWGTATPATFDLGVQSGTSYGFLDSVSCSSAGNCVAAGQFEDSTGAFEAFTQTKSEGIWANAIPATFAPRVQSAKPSDRFNSVSCSSAGNCVAAGNFKNAAGYYEAFTQTQSGGSWGTATPATFGVGIQSSMPNDTFYSVSCPSAGKCVAVGEFKNTAGGTEAFTQTQTGGTWATATPAIFGSGIQNATTNAWAGLLTVSCPSAGNCVAVGIFLNTAGDTEGFTQTQTGRIWANATPTSFAPGIQSTTPETYARSVSCYSAGNCVVAGLFKNATGNYEAFTQTQSGGSWGTATPATFGVGIQSTMPDAGFSSASCSSAGNCVAVGYFKNAAGNYEAFTQTRSAPKTYTLRAKHKYAAKTLAKQAGVAVVSKKAAVAIKVARASKKICTKSGSKLKTLKAGRCVVTFTVQEPKPKTGKKPKARKSARTFVVI